MTDSQLDQLIRKLALDALDSQWTTALETAPTMPPSQKHKNEMQKMLADHKNWYRKRTRTLWKKVMLSVASVAAIITILFGTVMVAIPTVRASVIRWAKEFYETHMVYQYTGQADLSKPILYEITKLPEGYEEKSVLELPGYTKTTYENEYGETIQFCCTTVTEGFLTSFSTENMSVLDFSIHNTKGYLLISQDPQQTNAVTWINPEETMQFTIDGFLDKEQLIQLAQSVQLVKK